MRYPIQPIRLLIPMLSIACADAVAPECGALGRHLQDTEAFPPNIDYQVFDAPNLSIQDIDLSEGESAFTFLLSDPHFVGTEAFLAAGESLQFTFRGLGHRLGDNLVDAYATTSAALAEAPDFRIDPIAIDMVGREEDDVRQVDLRFRLDDHTPLADGHNQLWVVIVGRNGLGPAVARITRSLTVFKSFVDEPNLVPASEAVVRGPALPFFQILSDPRDKNRFSFEYTVQSLMDSDECGDGFVERSALLVAADETFLPIAADGSRLIVVEVPSGETRNIRLEFTTPSHHRPDTLQVFWLPGFQMPSQTLHCDGPCVFLGQNWYQPAFQVGVLAPVR